LQEELQIDLRFKQLYMLAVRKEVVGKPVRRSVLSNLLKADQENNVFTLLKNEELSL